MDTVKRARKLINEYCRREFDEEAYSYNDDGAHYPLLYTTFGDDEEHDIQVETNVFRRTITAYWDNGTVVREDRYTDKEYLEELATLDFNDWFTWFVEEYYNNRKGDSNGILCNRVRRS